MYLQYAVWLALSTEGRGVSIQHYNPLIDDKVREKGEIPKARFLEFKKESLYKIMSKV
ncbi:hypothetical protein ACM6L3_06155 [Paenibacillus larvae]